jgi:two-component system, LytTR family, sensor histidine kinase AlgZ
MPLQDKNEALSGLIRRPLQMPIHFKPKHPTDILWRAPALISVVMAGEGLALIMTLAPGSNVDRWVYFGLSSLIIQWVILLTLGVLYLFRHHIIRLSIHAISWLGLGICILSTWLICSLFWFMSPHVASTSENSALFFLLQCTAIAITVGLLGLITLQHYWRGHQLVLSSKQAELDALQARIQPHFLFNTLNTGAALVHQNPTQAEQLLLDLSELFRAALSNSKIIKLDEELLLTRRYLEIEVLRFQDRLRIHWQLPEPIPDVLLPALSIQPLAENAVKHGIETSAAGGEIDISVVLNTHEVLIKVSNALPGTINKLRTGHQIGLASTRERIENYTDGKGHLLTVTENGRFVATISLPLP